MRRRRLPALVLLLAVLAATAAAMLLVQAAGQADDTSTPGATASGKSEIQLTVVVASHVHSGCVVTARVPVPPPASTIEEEAASET